MTSSFRSGFFHLGAFCGIFPGIFILKKFYVVFLQLVAPEFNSLHRKADSAAPERPLPCGFLGGRGLNHPSGPGAEATGSSGCSETQAGGLRVSQTGGFQHGQANQTDGRQVSHPFLLEGVRSGAVPVRGLQGSL
ncbi:MAG: hypothetical protein KA419_13990 [Acidobacteria bacterium]|nr:hypothetical protein [Acidobacteriota bacterium]